MVHSSVDMRSDATLEKVEAARRRWRAGLRFLGVIALALALNLLVVALPPRWFAGWGGYGYLGVFMVTLLANATVVIPVPYPGVVARLATELSALPVALLGASGSAIGEATGFLVGRAGKKVVEQNRFYLWLRHQLRTPLRAFAILFLLSAPPNPVFDIAGLTAGSLAVPFPVFLAATFCGRIIRMLILAGLGQSYL